MSPQDFNLLASGKETSSAGSSWLTKIVIDQLDEGTLLAMIDRAIGGHDRFLSETRARHGLAITSDRALRGGMDAGNDLKDRVFAAFDELGMLRDVRERLIRKISDAPADPSVDP